MLPPSGVIRGKDRRELVQLLVTRRQTPNHEYNTTLLIIIISIETFTVT